MSSTGTNADQPRKKESTEREDGVLKVLADDWEIVRRRKVELFFLFLIVALILGLVTRLDMCPAWQSHLIQTYLCESPYRGRLLWGAYIGYAIVSVVVLCVRDYRSRKTGALVIRHLITGEDFYKILFDGIKNSVVAIALGTTIVLVFGHGVNRLENGPSMVRGLHFSVVAAVLVPHWYCDLLDGRRNLIIRG
jgi:hypothetical protein